VRQSSQKFLWDATPENPLTVPNFVAIGQTSLEKLGDGQKNSCHGTLLNRVRECDVSMKPVT